MCQNQIPLSEKIFKTIDFIQQRKKTNRISPDHALLIKDMLPELKIEVSQILEQCIILYRQQKIVGGKTINDTWFRINLKYDENSNSTHKKETDIKQSNKET